MSIGKRLLILAFILSATAQAATPKPGHLGDGIPGCYKLFRSAPMSANEVRSLPPECRHMREDYFDSVNLATKHPEQYEKMLVTTLTKAKKANQPYEAIFFATLLHSDDLVKALKAREAVEEKLKLPYVYARAALFRLSGKPCSENPAFAFSAYQEICYADDDVLPHVFYRHYTPQKRKAAP